MRTFWLAILSCFTLVTSLRADDATVELIRKIDMAVNRGTKFLIQQQDQDGAWRAKSYPAFKEGDALTPLVLTALLPLPQDTRLATASENGLNYLAKLGRPTVLQPEGTRTLAFPSYTAAQATLALHQWRRPADDELRAAWVKYLKQLQLTEATGWQPGDPQYGGWGYAAAATQKPVDGSPLGPIAEPNMSATVYALLALQAGGVPTTDAAVASGLRFVLSLQNANGETTGNEQLQHNAGGFFFVHNDPVRNKAGFFRRGDIVVYRSYGSTTCDGILVLLSAGAQTDDGRLGKSLQLADHWLSANLTVDRVPGDYATDRAAARNGVYFYYVASLAQAIKLSRQAPKKQPLKQAVDNLVNATVVADLVGAILAKQGNDGSWKNPVPEQREDEPLVATTLAIQALTACRAVLLGDNKPVVTPHTNGELVAHARDATCHGEKLQFEPQAHKNTLGYWVNPADWASWKLAVRQAGRYRVVIWQGCGKGQGGSEIELAVAAQALKLRVEETGHFQNFVPREVGEIAFDRPGEYDVALRAISKAKGAVGDVRQIQFIPVERK